MHGLVEEIYLAPEGGARMEKVEQAEALAGFGLRGDRYCERRGYYSYMDSEVCQVTLIEAEDLEEVARTAGLHVLNGEHRRNLVTRGVRLEQLAGKRFRIGTAVLEYDRTRPPCSYLQSLTEPGMTCALVERSGICARVIKSGLIRSKDPITIL